MKPLHPVSYTQKSTTADNSSRQQTTEGNTVYPAQFFRESSISSGVIYSWLREGERKKPAESQRSKEPRLAVEAVEAVEAGERGERREARRIFEGKRKTVSRILRVVRVFLCYALKVGFSSFNIPNHDNIKRRVLLGWTFWY